MNPILTIDFLLPILAIGIGLALFLGWRSSASVGRPLRVGLLALRVLGLAGLVVLALNPGRWTAPVERTDSDWAVLVDRSASMATKDVAGGARWTEALRLAGKAAGLADDVKRVRPFTFAERLDEEAASLDAVRQRVQSTGLGTDIPGALNELFSRYQARQRRLAGVLVLSDGRQRAVHVTDEAIRQSRALGAPVYAVALGGPVATPDASIEPVHPFEVGFAGSPLRLTARVRNANLGPIRPRVKLLTAEGKDAAPAAVVSVEPGAMADVTLSVKPATGFVEYVWALDEVSGDAIPDNNRASVGVLGLREPLRVLVAEGVPHWDSKFLVQWMRKQPQFALTTVHRLASERFFRIGGESGNEDALTREVFPDTLEALGAYDLVVLGKGAEYFLTGDRPAVLRRYVREQGGGLLFARSKAYQGEFQALADLEPLTWAAALPADAAATVWRPTAEGEAAGLFGGALPGADAAVWSRLPKVTPQYLTGPLPSFATVLVAGEGRGNEATPLVAARRYGKGRTAAVNVEGLWRWDFFPANDESGPLYKAFWPELVQWLATHGDFLPGRSVSLRLSADRCQPDEPVQAVMQRRGAAAAGQAAPVLRVMTAGLPAQEIRPQRLPGDDGWATVFTPPAPGLYRFEATLEGSVSTEGPAIALLRVPRPPAEADEVGADPDYLAKLAEATGGALIPADGLERAVRAFDAKAPEAIDAPPVWKPAWDRAWLLALMVGVFGAEWFMRRRSGLL